MDAAGRGDAVTTQQYAGAEWVKALKHHPHMSPLGIAAANLLGDVFQGIYHIDTPQFRGVAWNDPNCITVPINNSLCTVDFDHLTRLVVLAHDRMIRVDIQGQCAGWLRLLFHQRHSRTGERFERYETIEDHAAMLRRHYSDSSI